MSDLMPTTRDKRKEESERELAVAVFFNCLSYSIAGGVRVNLRTGEPKHEELTSDEIGSTG